MIRPYHKNDKPKLLELIRLNTPKYFAVEETSDFDAYLENGYEDYFVLEKNEVVVGCGGINYKNETAIISWDMLHPNFHGQGLGSKLLEYRINKIKTDSKYSHIVVRTSQFAHVFYEKGGFKLVKTEADYWSKGIHLYQMELFL